MKYIYNPGWGEDQVNTDHSTPSQRNYKNHNNLHHPRKQHKNPNHQRCRVNRHLIRRAICEGISERSFRIRASEICQNAGISSPTFYLHYPNSERARECMEIDIVKDLQRTLTTKSCPELVFTILTSGIVHNQQYFIAVHLGSDHRVLTKFIARYRHNLVGDEITDRVFRAYCGIVQIVIGEWIEYDELTLETAARTTRRLLRISLRDINEKCARMERIR